MLSKNEIKIIKSLHQKKFRDETGMFIVEGPKLCEELNRSDFVTDRVIAINSYNGEADVKVDKKTLERISALKSPNEILAVAHQKKRAPEDFTLSGKLTLALDDIKDPGNLGTIMRIADWFGIDQIICSMNTVDMYNPKVVQSSMGSVFRIKVLYCDLPEFLRDVDVPVYGTFMEGSNIYNEKLSEEGVIVMGSESHGISASVGELVSNRVHIPSFGGSAESLNVAIACSLVCSEFRRG